MAARTIPFPSSTGAAATKTTSLQTPPNSGAATGSQLSRRYRGLQLVTRDRVRNHATGLTSLEQTRAIVAQVEHEIRQQAARQRMSRPGLLLVPSRQPQARLEQQAQTSLRSARRFMLSLIPAGSL